MDDLKFDNIRDETARTYTFPKGKVRIVGVTKICVRPSGIHRLECINGEKHIIAPGWLSIQIEAERWSK